MGQPLTISGALINVYINNQLYKVVQSITLEVDYGEEQIFGIDSCWPQEIAGNKVTVRGSVKGLRNKMSGGLQGSNLRPLFTDIGAAPYVSIRIQDRSTSEDIVLIPNAKVTNESHTAAVKGVYRLSFDFIGQIPLFSLDRSDP
jgi:hypothetical protein